MKASLSVLGRLDPGGEAVLQRKFALVLVDRAREMFPRSRSTAWTARPAATAARPYRRPLRESRASRTSTPADSVSSVRPGYLLTSAFDSLDRVQGESAAPGIVAGSSCPSASARRGAMAITAPKPPGASSLSKVEFGGAICSRDAAAAIIGDVEQTCGSRRRRCRCRPQPRSSSSSAPRAI